MQVITRTLGILSQLGQVPTGLSLQQLSDRLQVPVPSTHRLLAVLCDAGFVVRVPSTRRYLVGPEAFSLGAAAARSRRLQRTPPQPLVRAAASTGDTLFLTEMVGSRSAVCVAVAPGRRLTTIPVQLGQMLPVGTMSCTRVLLLDVPDEQLGRIVDHGVGGQAPGQESVQGYPEDSMARLRISRRWGFDVGTLELGPDTWMLSVPVREPSGRVRQSLTVITPVRHAAREQVRRSVLMTAQSVARELSCVGPVGVTGRISGSHAKPGPLDVTATATLQAHGLMTG